jgi:LysR family transcriptional regulator, glycine cleavage system transcriptional activator
MKRRLPPWGAIEAFIVAARSRSFKDAAARLGLSPAAFSRRIQALESQVGIRLFDREAPLPVLTAAGRAYLDRLKPGYEAVRAATEELCCASEQGRIRIGVSHSFAVSWLVPRLPAFDAQSHGIELSLQWNNDDSDLLGGTADIAIMYGDGEWPGLSCQKLMPVSTCVVSAPRLAGGRAGPARLDELPGYRLLDLVYPARQWESWLERAGYSGPLPAERMTFDCGLVMCEAAALGLGLAIGGRPLVDSYLASGRLQRAFDLSFPAPGAYYLVALPSVRRQRRTQLLWQWLVAEAAAFSEARAAA